MRRLTWGLLAAAICSLVAASAASACTFAVAPGLTQAELDRAAFRASDAALIGRVVAFDPRMATIDYVIRVGRAVKGRFPLGYALVRTSSSTCGLRLQLGERMGLMMNRRGGHWRVDALDWISPRALLRAARRH